MNKEDFIFTTENTDGYNQEQLEELNKRFTDWWDDDNIDQNCEENTAYDWHSYIAHYSEAIQEKYDSELAESFLLEKAISFVKQQIPETGCCGDQYKIEYGTYSHIEIKNAITGAGYTFFNPDDEPCIYAIV